MDLTILITVMGRHFTLPRVLEYYREFEGNVILLDQTIDPWDDILKYDYVEYIHLPNSDWSANMCHAFNQITTKYTMVVGDDDFVMLNNMGGIVSFLEQNPDYVSASGQQISMEDNLFRYETLIYLAERDVAQSAYVNVLHNKALERMKFYWSIFNARNHSVITTQVQKEIYRLHFDYPSIYAIRTFDKTLGLILAAKGRVITLPAVSVVRSFENKVRECNVLNTLGKICRSDISGDIFKPISDNRLYNHNKPDIRFEKTFLEMDLDPLLSYLDISKEFLHKIYKLFCDENIQKDILETIYKRSISCGTTLIPVQGKLDKSYAQIYKDESNLGEQKFLCLKPEKIYEDVIKEHSSKPDLYEDVFPIFKKENIDELSKIYSFVENYPLPLPTHV